VAELWRWSDCKERCLLDKSHLHCLDSDYFHHNGQRNTRCRNQHFDEHDGDHHPVTGITVSLNASPNRQTLGSLQLSQRVPLVVWNVHLLRVEFGDGNKTTVTTVNTVTHKYFECWNLRANVTVTDSLGAKGIEPDPTPITVNPTPTVAVQRLAPTRLMLASQYHSQPVHWRAGTFTCSWTFGDGITAPVVRQATPTPRPPDHRSPRL